MSSAEALELLLSASGTSAVQDVSLEAEAVVFPGGPQFPRELLTEIEGLRAPLRLDVLLFFAKHASRNGWTVDRVLYVKEAREVGISTVDVVERAKLLAFLKTASEERQSKRPRTSGAAAFVLNDGLLSRPAEGTLASCRPLSDRNTVLLSKTKSFAPVLELLQASMKGQLRPRDGRAALAAAPLVKSSRYKEVQEQRFWQERLGTRDVDELGIDTNASFLADALHPLPPIAPPPAPPVAAPQPRPVVAAPSVPRPAPKEKEGGIPIIIVPSGLGSQVLVNMYNARSFLEDSEYVSWEVKKQQKPDAPKETMIEIKRKFGRSKPVLYQITDKAPPKKSPDWARVVAVIVQGSAWQLKEFPFKGAAEGHLVDTFASISAFYVRFDSDPIPEFVKKWSVNSLVLAKTTRYGDRGVLEKLWSVLDSALAARRSPLNY